ncbi:alpha/beta fold hydrolase [Segetibacter sp. 3557_3]|uniref:alpha/beta hydrolase n=1 Tax=Segetibacter sp. 3557_3 TaxID=2547429 RepID=UPI001058FD37|nr:alpha/beta fold hydrolase [Segetibacter sp. 3557_3]TDH29047.1 alpha/beta fold hydrolase [Segetibacter sp. 3557_3]
MTEGVYELRNGRKLGYALYGPGDGERVLYFHGTPSSRLEPLILGSYHKNIEELLHHFHLQLVSIDRPGMGRSTFDPRGDFRSFAIDVQELTTDWEISRTKVLCWSGGGPFALSLAYHFPSLIRQVYIITGFSRSFSEPRVFRNMNGNIYYFWAARNIPWLLRRILNFIGKREAHRPIPRWLSGLPDVDHALLSDPATINHFSKCTLNEACRQGSAGLVHDAAGYFGETGYHLQQIAQPVHYWYGLKDNTVSNVHPAAVEKYVPNATMHYKENEGHLSVYINWIEEVLQTIKENS